MAPKAITYFDDFRGPNKYAFLSNFWQEPVLLGGKVYPTGEHAFQAFKARTTSAHEAVRRCPTPSAAKAKGRSIPLRPDWEAVKYDVMRQVLRAKFAMGSELAHKLMNTGNAMLIEGTEWHDQVWGVEAKTMKGRNWLGHLLMARRAELRAGYDEPDHSVALRYIRKVYNA